MFLRFLNGTGDVAETASAARVLAFDQGDGNRELRVDCAEEYRQTVMHRRLAAIVLVMVLVGANTAVASVCAACCAVEKNDTRHHHADTMSPSSHHHPAAQHPMASCGQCPLSMGMAGSEPERCAEGQALVEKSQVFSRDRAVQQSYGVKTSAALLPKPADSAGFSHFHPPPKLTSFDPILVSLRI